MQGVPHHFDSPADSAEFRLPSHRPGIELYRAHIVRHAFEPHMHDGFGLGAIESGVERFRYRGADHLAPPDSLVMMNPDELHTGRAETEGGWHYRMVYIEPSAVDEITGEPGWWFDDAVRTDVAGAGASPRCSTRYGRHASHWPSTGSCWSCCRRSAAMRARRGPHARRRLRDSAPSSNACANASAIASRWRSSLPWPA